jgi:hypothetical protein
MTDIHCTDCGAYIWCGNEDCPACDNDGICWAPGCMRDVDRRREVHKVDWGMLRATFFPWRV